MTFQVEKVADWAKECGSLVFAHWQELGLDLDLKIDPDFEKMQIMEQLGIFTVITVRDGRELVGYLLAVVSAHLHYRSSPKMFIVDAYYVKPEYRNGAGVKLLRFAEHLARTLGAIKIYLSCKVHKDHSGLFEQLGYQLSDYAFIKRI